MMPIASWFCNGYSKVLTALKCSKKLEKAVKAVFWNQLLFALKYVLALSKRLKDVFFFYVYLVAAKVPGTYYQARRSFSSLLGPLHWSSIFPTPREHRNIVQLCTRSPHPPRHKVRPMPRTKISLLVFEDGQLVVEADKVILVTARFFFQMSV